MDPSIDWKKINSDHFTVIYDSKHREMAEAYTDFAENAYRTLTPIFNSEAPSKTQIVITDNSDLANGAAISVPYPSITTYAVLPSSSDPISDYGNWGQELLMHEYTHILNMEPAHGIMTPFKYIFGNIVRPNMMLPRWYLEGLAVETETRFSNYGRLRSPNFTAIARSMALDGSLMKEDIARINEVSIPSFPGGSRPYLMGSLLWHEMIMSKDLGVVGRLNQRFSERFPFFITLPMLEEFEQGYQSMLDQTYEKITQRAKAQAMNIQAQASFSSQNIESIGFDVSSPNISPNQKKLIYISHPLDADQIVELRERESVQTSFSKTTSIKLLEATGTQRVSWLDDGNEFVYDHIDSFNRYNYYSDLYKYNIQTKKKTQLTKGLRAREPSVRADGQKIVFTQMDAGKTHLAMLDSDGSNFKRLYSPGFQIRVARPEFLDEQKIIFSEKSLDGREKLKVLDLSLNQIYEVLSDAKNDFTPSHNPKKTNSGLVFTSERSGVPNLYLASSDLKSAKAITHTTTSASSADIDIATGELVFTDLKSSGQKLSFAQAKEWQQLRVNSEKIDPLIEDTWPKYENQISNVDKEYSDFSSWPYLLPRYWIPFIYFIPGGTYFSASTSAGDPLGKNSYSLNASYDTLTERPSFSLILKNTQLTTPLLLSLNDIYDYIYAGNIVRHTTIAQPLIESFIPGLSNKWLMGAGWSYYQSQYLNNLLVRNGPQFFVSYVNETQKGEQISPESGGSFSLSQATYLPSLGSIDYEEINLRARGYFSKYLPKRHVLASSLNLSYAPRLQRDFIGKTTSSAVFQGGTLDSSFLLRGYPYGALIGHNLYTANIEYRFPLYYRYGGSGTDPIFIQKLYGDVFTDIATVDGYYYSPRYYSYFQSSVGRYFVGSGVETKMDMTLFYHWPVTAVLGLYYGHDRDASLGLTPFLGFIL